MGKNAYTKIIETSHELRVLHAEWPMADIYLARGEVLIEAGNYPMAVKDVEAAIVLKRTGKEGSRARAEVMHQPGVTQAYASKVIKSDMSLNNAVADLKKRKKNREKLASSHSIDRGVAGMRDCMEDLCNVVPEQRDRLKNQSGKRVTSLWGKIDSIMARAIRENSRTWSQDREISEGEEVEVRKRPSIIIGILFDRLSKTLAQFHTRFKSHCSSKLGKQGESGSKDSQAEFLHIRAPGQPHTKGP